MLYIADKFERDIISSAREMGLRGTMQRYQSIDDPDYKITVQGKRVFVRQLKASIAVHTVSSIHFNVEEEMSGYNKREFVILPPVPRDRPKPSDLLRLH